MKELWVYCDVDGTLIDQDDVPRPHILDMFVKFQKLGVFLIVWSAGGHDYAERKIGMISRKLNYDLSPFVTGYLWKAWADRIVTEHRFYIDDESGLLDSCSRNGYATFKVPFYISESRRAKDDVWLLNAAHAVETYYNTLNPKL